jgi:hypothetical protein
VPSFLELVDTAAPAVGAADGWITVLDSGGEDEGSHQRWRWQEGGHHGKGAWLDPGAFRD